MTRHSASLVLPQSPAVPARVPAEPLARLVLGLVILVAIWVGLAPYTAAPAVVPADAPAHQFSAERAMADLAVVAAEPHPIGSARQAIVRDYLVEQIRALGLQPEIQRTTVTRREELPGMYASIAVENILVRVPGSDSQGAIVLEGHYDSVSATPGATDCGACAVTVLEALRAIVAGAPLKNDVIFILADGEENHIAGAEAFMQQHAWAKDVRFTVVFEGMGYDGASMLYSAAPGAGWWEDQALQAMPHPLGFSYINTIMRPLGGSSSDLEAYIAGGRPGLAFVSFGPASAAAYHTAADNVGNFDPRSLQHHGDYAVSLVRHFGNLPLQTAPDVASPIYFPLVPYVMVRYPAAWAVPLGLVTLAAFVAVTGLGWRRGCVSLGGMLGSSLAFVFQLAAVVVVTTLAWQGLRWVLPGLRQFSAGGSYRAPFYLWALVALTLGGLSLVHGWLRRRLGLGSVALGAVAWWVLLAVLTGLAAPGLSYLFTWPALAALAALGWSFTRPHDAERPWARALAMALPAVTGGMLVAPALVFLHFFAGRLEGVLGVPLMAVPMLFAALLIGLLWPAIEWLAGGARRWLPLGGALVFALGVLLAGVLIRPDARHPVSNTIVYWLDVSAGQAKWITADGSASGQAGLDSWTQQFFPNGGQATTFKPFLNGLTGRTLPALEALAPLASLPTSTVEVLADTTSGGQRTLRLKISTPEDVPDSQVRLSASGSIIAVTVNGTPLDLAGQSTDTVQLNLTGRHKGGTSLELVIPTGPLSVVVQDHHLGLPNIPGLTIEPRPAWMVAAPLNDVADATIVSRTWGW